MHKRSIRLTEGNFCVTLDENDTLWHTVSCGRFNKAVSCNGNKMIDTNHTNRFTLYLICIICFEFATSLANNDPTWTLIIDIFYAIFFSYS